jgi:hypothetical protein
MLAAKRQNFSSFHLIESKQVVRLTGTVAKEIAGVKNEGESRDVVENKWWGNA